MKNSLLFVLFFLISLSVKAQQYHPLLNNTCWYQSYSNFGSTSQFFYYYDGDTLFNSITYKKYRVSTYYPYLFLLREDTVQRKVFIVQLAYNDTIEKLLYDFNLTVGMQFTFYAYSGFPFVGTVTQVDSVLTGVGYRKRWTSQANGLFVTHIEQVGSIEDPIDWSNMGMDPTPTLICSYSGTQQVYYYNGGISCPAACLATGIPDINSEMTFNIFPNPTSGTFTINQIVPNENTLVEIINAIGQVVFSEKIHGRNEYVVDATLTKGIYFVQLSSPERRVVSKLAVN